MSGTQHNAKIPESTPLTKPETQESPVAGERIGVTTGPSTGVQHHDRSTRETVDPVMQAQNHDRLVRDIIDTSQHKDREFEHFALESFYGLVDVAMRMPPRRAAYGVDDEKRHSSGSILLHTDRPFTVKWVPNRSRTSKHDLTLHLEFLPKPYEQFPLLKFPPEIVSMVLRAALVKADPITITSHVDTINIDASIKCLGILGTCKRLLSEGRSLLYGENEFVFASTTSFKVFYTKHHDAALLLENVTIQKWAASSGDSLARHVCSKGSKLQVLEISDPATGDGVFTMAKIARDMADLVSRKRRNISLRELLNKVVFERCAGCFDGRKARVARLRKTCACRQGVFSRVHTALLEAMIMNREELKLGRVTASRDEGWEAVKAEIMRREGAAVGPFVKGE